MSFLSDKLQERKLKKIHKVLNNVDLRSADDMKGPALFSMATLFAQQYDNKIDANGITINTRKIHRTSGYADEGPMTRHNFSRLSWTKDDLKAVIDVELVRGGWHPQQNEDTSTITVKDHDGNIVKDAKEKVGYSEVRKEIVDFVNQEMKLEAERRGLSPDEIPGMNKIEGVDVNSDISASTDGPEISKLSESGALPDADQVSQDRPSLN